MLWIRFLSGKNVNRRPDNLAVEETYKSSTVSKHRPEIVLCENVNRAFWEEQ